MKKLLADQMLKSKALEIALEKTSEPGAAARCRGEGPDRAVLFRESRLPAARGQPLGQRPRVHRQVAPAIAQRKRDQGPLHRPRMPLAERVRRELQ